MQVGVLALQGAFREHREAFDALGVSTTEVRTPDDLGGVDALIIPGGESTTILKLLETSALAAPLKERLNDAMPTFGTCAGLILLARVVVDGRADQVPLNAIDLTVRRNAYGTQLASFEVPLTIEGMDGAPFPGVFIRAPVVEAVGEHVEVLAEHSGRPVLVRQGRIWASTFHPELSGDLRVHERFLDEVMR
ncbi:MAG: pyridoxal 5'-phosphate synthase glutaminase subunit PdxT [Acidimicrobiia bacterium]|nr:pyridoxal 5'-phosphate synthase glutaminase subunit PdxT [Acidimicrobiia bacterium]